MVASSPAAASAQMAAAVSEPQPPSARCCVLSQISALSTAPPRREMPAMGSAWAGGAGGRANVRQSTSRHEHRKRDIVLAITHKPLITRAGRGISVFKVKAPCGCKRLE